MVSTFKRIPAPLRKQTLISMGFSLLFILLLIIMLFIARDLYLLLPCAGAAVFFAAATNSLFRRAILGDYLIISGECQSITFTAVKRRVKYITLQAGDQIIQVMLHSRLMAITEGTAVDLYVTADAPVYENGGVQILYNYLAIDIKHGRRGRV